MKSQNTTKGFLHLHRFQLLSYQQYLNLQFWGLKTMSICSLNYALLQRTLQLNMYLLGKCLSVQLAECKTNSSTKLKCARNGSRPEATAHTLRSAASLTVIMKCRQGSSSMASIDRSHALNSTRTYTATTEVDVSFIMANGRTRLMRALGNSQCGMLTH